MNNSFKNNIVALEAFKFGYASLIKNTRFLLLSVATSGLIFVGGLIASALAALLFFIPFFMVLEKLKEMFMRISMVNAFSSVMQGVAIDKASQSVVIWQKFLTEIFVSFPLSAAFAILGIFVFVALIFSMLMILALGWVKISLNIVDGRENKISALLIKPGILLKAIYINFIGLTIFALPIAAAAITFKISMVFGAILVLIATLFSIYLGFKFAYSTYFLLDKNIGVIDSIKSSFRLKNGVLNIIALCLIALPVSILFALLKNITDASSLYSIKLMLGSLSIVLQFIYYIVMIITMSKIYRMLVERS